MGYYLYDLKNPYTGNDAVCYSEICVPNRFVGEGKFSYILFSGDITAMPYEIVQRTAIDYERYIRNTLSFGVPTAVEFRFCDTHASEELKKWKQFSKATLDYLEKTKAEEKLQKPQASQEPKVQQESKHKENIGNLHLNSKEDALEIIWTDGSHSTIKYNTDTTIKEILDLVKDSYSSKEKTTKGGIKKVCYHDNNGIVRVFWADGTDTQVRCDARDHYSREAGLALCFMKKRLGENFKDVLRFWTTGD